MDSQGKSWKERLEAIAPQKSVSGVLREIKALGVVLSDAGLRKQDKKHGILKKSDGLYFIRVDTVLQLRIWKDKSGNFVADYSAAGSGLQKRFDLAKVRRLEAEARIKEREDLLAAGELISRDYLNQLLLAPAILIQKNIKADLPKVVEGFIDIVAGDHSKNYALVRELRFFIKKHFAQAYSSDSYRLTIDTANHTQKQQSLIDE